MHITDISGYVNCETIITKLYNVIKSDHSVFLIIILNKLIDVIISRKIRKACAAFVIHIDLSSLRIS